MNQRNCFFCVLAIIWPATAFPGIFGSSNYWECILDEMPGVKNDPAAIEVIKNCKKEFPNSTVVEKKSSLFGTKTAGECVLEYAADVSSPRGATLVRAACYKLYPRQ
jgi:hypothetical protein